jgi:hypothetical protein
MTIQEQVLQLPKNEKLKMMEALWTNLSRDSSDLVSPAWHETVLKETEARYAAGKEGFSDWEEAKKELRDRFQ